MLRHVPYLSCLNSEAFIEGNHLAWQVVRDVKELRKAIANKDGARVVELAAGVAFVLTDKPWVLCIDFCIS